MKDKEVEKNFREFWKPIIFKNGKLNMAQLKRELFDYSSLIRSVSIVYDSVTGGRISKPNTSADAVISEMNEYYRKLYEDDSSRNL